MAKLNNTEALVRLGIRSPQLRVANSTTFLMTSPEMACQQSRMRNTSIRNLPNGRQSSVGNETDARSELCK